MKGNRRCYENRKELLLQSWLGFVFLEEGGRPRGWPSFCQCFYFLLSQRLKANSGMNSGVKVKTNLSNTDPLFSTKKDKSIK